jgi:hypothetical protein
MFRRALLTASLLLVSCLPRSGAQGTPPAATAPFKDKWALVIGISEFEHSNLNLKYAAKDATDFRDFLVSKGNFAADHVRLLTNKQATRANILEQFGDSWLPRVAMPDDLVLIFISSHGSPPEMDVRGVNYVVAHDTNPDSLFATGVPLQSLTKTLKDRVHSNRIVIVLDVCHAGAVAESKGLVRGANIDAAAMADTSGHAVICSSSTNENSWESKQYPNSVFTHTLIEGLQKHGSQTKLGDAVTFMKEEVPREVQMERGFPQHPVFQTSKWNSADVVLAAVPTAPRPGLPAPIEPMSETAASQSAPQTVASVKSPNAIPSIAGRWIGTNGVVYDIWQNGRSTGWDMPQFNEFGRGTISEDGKTSIGFWYGPVTGHGTSQLEIDDKGRVIKMNADDGSVFTRVGR